jgi:DNA-binding GntR family transcriptional regulator
MASGPDIPNAMTEIQAAPALAPLGRSATRSDLVVESIRLAILSGRLAPGQSLVERRLAELLGVSKTPVREALISLASTGLVTVHPNRGVVVRQLDVDDLARIYEVRLLLEPWAVARTASAPPPEALAEARAALARARTLLAASDHSELSLANRRFHQALYAACGNEIVVRQLDDLQHLTALGIVSLLWERWPTWEEEFAEHEQLLAVVEKGDVPEAERLARTHVERSLSRLRAGGPTSG